MKKGLIISIILVIFLVGIFLLKRNEVDYIIINNQKIKVELAQSQEEITKGLSGRESLCADCGMLFILPESEKHFFWMKEMRFDLDFVWIKGNEVVKINENITHLKGEKEEIVANVLVDKVLEINAGKAKEWGIDLGDRVIFSK